MGLRLKQAWALPAPGHENATGDRERAKRNTVHAGEIRVVDLPGGRVPVTETDPDGAHAPQIGRLQPVEHIITSGGQK